MKIIYSIFKKKKMNAILKQYLSNASKINKIKELGILMNQKITSGDLDFLFINILILYFY